MVTVFVMVDPAVPASTVAWMVSVALAPSAKVPMVHVGAVKLPWLGVMVPAASGINISYDG